MHKILTQSPYSGPLSVRQSHAIYNLGQDICRLSQVLAKFPFSTSETEMDYHQKVEARVVLGVVKQVKI